MTTRIGVLSLDSDFVGSVASYFEPTNGLSAFGIPTEVDAMQNGVAEFSLNATSNICVRLDSTNGGVLRTGIQPASAVGEMDGNALELPYLIYPLEETLLFNDLTSGIAPISQNGATLSSLTVTRNGQNLVATGAVSFSTGVVGSISGTFTYEFRLNPVTSALSSRILTVDTVDVDVNINGVLGWILNGWINLLIELFEDRIGDALENVIQEQIDTAIADRLADEADVPDHIQATVQAVRLTASDVTVDVLVAVPAIVIDCPFVVAEGSVRIRRGEQLRKLRRMRSLVLKGNPRGEVYISLMRRHGRELARLVRKDRALLKKFDTVVSAGLEDFDEERPGDGKLKKGTATLARSLAADVREQASPTLRRAIDMAESDIDDFVGKPVRRVLDESTAKAAELAKANPTRRTRRG